MRMVPLAEAADINPRERVTSDEVVSFVGMAELDPVTSAARAREERTYSQVSNGYTVFRDQDILVAKITPCFENSKIGQAHLETAIGVGSTEFHVIRPRGDLDARYLLHFLRQPWVLAAGELRMTGSAGQRRVPVAFLRDLSIPLPQIVEQRRIAAILDKADAIRAKRRDVLAHLDDLTQSIFAQSVSAITRVATFSEAGVDFVSGRNVLAAGSSGHRVNRVVKVSAVSTGRFDPSEAKPMPTEYSPPEAHRIRRGDVLFGRASGSIDLLGATTRVDVDVHNLFLPDKVWRVEVRDGAPVSLPYVFGVLRSPGARAFIRHNASGAAGVYNIAKAKLADLRMPLPPPEVQDSFAARMEALDSRRSSAGAALELGDELLLSLQSRAFKGEL